jgi:tRNA dimethylallyltransferase
MSDTKPFLRILLGCTASGKERTALACAERLGGQIISVDSMKIYRGLDVGTAKASPAVRERIIHHCLDLADPGEIFSVARYVEAAEDAIYKTVEAKNIPILSGGTALYYKGLLEGLFDGPPADDALREVLEKRAAAEGCGALHAELSKLDPKAAEKIHANDVRRVTRALEVITLTGKPMSSHQTQWDSERGMDAGALLYPCGIVGLLWPREILYKRIEERVRRMLDNGLEREAQTVYETRRDLSRTPLQAVGYKEFFDYFEGNATFADAVELLCRNTRHLAKSQMTWFRKFPCRWIEMDERMTADDTATLVIDAWRDAEKSIEPGEADEA